MSSVNGEIVSDNKNLQLEKTIVTLPFQPTRLTLTEIQNLSSPTDVKKMWFPWLPGTEVNSNDKTVWKPDWAMRIMIIADMTQKDVSGNTVNWAFTRFNPATSTNVTQFSSTLVRTAYFPEWKIEAGGVRITSGELHLTWEEMLRKYWFPIENSMLKNPTKVVARFNLSARDVLSFRSLLASGKHGGSVPVYVKQLNGRYLVNKISRFIPGELTDVELIRL